MTLRHLALFALPVSLAASSAGAISTYQSEVPNGTVFRCQTCHVRSGGGEGWNPFGISILEAGEANPDANPNNQNDGFIGSPADYWLDLCDDDADGDGATNAEELDDFDCDGEADGTAVNCAGAAEGPNGEPCVSNPGDETSSPGDPGDPNDDTDDIGTGGGCAAAPVAPAGLFALGLLLMRRRKKSL